MVTEQEHPAQWSEMDYFAVHFRDPSHGYSGREGVVRWESFVSFIRDPKNKIKIVQTIDSVPGEYRVIVDLESRERLLAWFDANGVVHS